MPQKCESIYIARDWIIKQETDNPMDRYISAAKYFLFEDSALYCFREAHKRRLRGSGVAISGKTVRVSPLRENDINVIPVRNNSIGNILMEWDEIVYKQDGSIYHNRKELSLARLQPEISITLGANGSRHYVFEYEEYVVLDDSEYNHKGFVQTSEFYSSAERAYQRLSTQLTYYLTSMAYKVGRTWDDRVTWFDKFEEGDFLNNVFACELIENGRCVRMLYVHAASCNGDNSKPILYI